MHQNRIILALSAAALLLVVGLFHSSVSQEYELLNAPKHAEDLDLVVEEQGTVSKAVLIQEMRESMTAAGVACSGPAFNAHTCSMWWEKDVTVYDMKPPHGVVRGREAWEKRLQVVIKEEPHDEMTFHVEDAGWMGGDSEEDAWANGFWAKFLDGKLSKQGRYSAVMRRGHSGNWRFFIASSIEMQNDADWVPVSNGRGGELLIESRKIMTTFAMGYNQRNFRLAFADYSAHARFPFMKELGGTSLSFAVSSLNSQTKKMTPARMAVSVDEAQVIGKKKLTGVAHGFSKMTDAGSNIYTMGKFSFLVILDRQSETSPWKVKYDFSPNNWLLAPNVH